MFLAKLLIGKEEDGRVTRLLKQVLDKSPNRALDVLELLESHVINLGDNTVLHFVYIDAALLLGRAETVITMLRKIYQAKKHRANLVSWLDQQFRDRSVPAEILSFSGEIALKEAMYGKAIEIFKEILSYGPQDEPAIKEILSQYRSNSLVDHFLRDQFNEAPIQARTAQPEFETCDRLNFVPPKKPKETEDDNSIPGAQGQNDRHPEFAADEFTLGSDESSSELGLDNHDFSLGLGNSEAPPAETAEQQPERDDSRSESTAKDGDESDLFTYLQRNIPDEPSYFKDDDTSESVADDDTLNYVPPPLQDTAKELITDSATYEAGYNDNRLNGNGYLELAEQALNKGALDEAKEHLAFDPANLAEEIRRKYLLAAYYLAAERPIQALVVLRSVQLIGLSRDEKKDYLLRIAECYQRLHNFEAAHSVFLRIMADHPDVEMAEHMAKVNYERYLRKICGEESVLEKITSL
jgi:tetratricopeptide (TPR) repeat protein